MPLLVEPSKLDAVIAALAPRFGINDLALVPGLYTTEPGEKRYPGYRVQDGIAVIDVFGALVHRGGYDAESTYFLGYQDVGRRCDTALGDGEVEGIAFQIDSPGGEVSGAHQLAAQVYAARGAKPMTAVVSNVAASAAYLLAAAVGDISVSPTGFTSSIGVVLRHVDMSRLLANDGITVTQIYAGAAKVDGNPYEPLSVTARERFQADVSTLYDQFVSAIDSWHSDRFSWSLPLRKCTRSSNSSTRLGAGSTRISSAGSRARTGAAGASSSKKTPQSG